MFLVTSIVLPNMPQWLHTLRELRLFDLCMKPPHLQPCGLHNSTALVKILEFSVYIILLRLSHVETTIMLQWFQALKLGSNSIGIGVVP